MVHGDYDCAKLLSSLGELCPTTRHGHGSPAGRLAASQFLVPCGTQNIPGHLGLMMCVYDVCLFQFTENITNEQTTAAPSPSLE